MIKMGLPIGAVQNAIERDGLDPKNNRNAVKVIDPKRANNGGII